MLLSENAPLRVSTCHTKYGADILLGCSVEDGKNAKL